MAGTAAPTTIRPAVETASRLSLVAQRRSPSWGWSLPAQDAQAARPADARHGDGRRPAHAGRSTASSAARPSSATPSTSPASSPGRGRRAWPPAAPARSSPTTSSPTALHRCPGRGLRTTRAQRPGPGHQGLRRTAAASTSAVTSPPSTASPAVTSRPSTPANGSLVTGRRLHARTSAARCAASASRASTVYVGGNFLSANGVARTRLAAFSTSQRRDAAVGPHGRRAATSGR